jgi:hypothetical protein
VGEDGDAACHPGYGVHGNLVVQGSAGVGARPLLTQCLPGRSGDRRVRNVAGGQFIHGRSASHTGADSNPDADTNSDASAQSNPRAEPDADTASYPNANSRADTGSHANAKPNDATDSQGDIETDTHSEPEPDPNGRSSDTHAHRQRNTDPDPRTDPVGHPHRRGRGHYGDASPLQLTGQRDRGA